MPSPSATDYSYSPLPAGITGRKKIVANRAAENNAAAGPSTIPVVAVLGLSGSEQEKGPIGVGKSTLCNRMVRPNYVDFSTEHINCLSQADFLSPVINSQHWLYWGDAKVSPAREQQHQSHGPGTTAAQLRIIEQTVFLDDERFEPLGNAFRKGRLLEDYQKLALSTKLESVGKIAYQNRDQLGQENDFLWQELPTTSNSQLIVDAFCVLFDVSMRHSLLASQCAVVSSLLLEAVKNKKSVVFCVGTKFDAASAEGLAEWQKLLTRKELKQVAQNIHTVEISAVENVNVSELLSLMASTLERRRQRHHHNGRHLHHVQPYKSALQCRKQRIDQICDNFRRLLESAAPKEEYILQRGQTSWHQLLVDYGMSAHADYAHFVNEFGPAAAKSIFEEHMRESREWWFEHELSVRLSSLRDILRRMFERSFLCQVKWPQLTREIEQHPEFDAFFQPLGRSLDRLSTIDEQWDERLPSEILQKPESHLVFAEFQRELLDEIALERQADKFRTLLAQRDPITPGRTFRDAKVLVEELEAFEQVLPEGAAVRIYEQFQEGLQQRALRDFQELLLEHIELFVDIIVDWRTRHPELPPFIGLNEHLSSVVHKILQEHKRYRNLNGLSALRSLSIEQHASFLSLPLERHCPAGTLCSDLTTSILFQRQIQNNSSMNSFYKIALNSNGPAPLIQLLNDAIRWHTNSAQMFVHNGLTVQFSVHCEQQRNISSSNCPSPSTSSPSLSAPIASQIFLFSTLEEAEEQLQLLPNGVLPLDADGGTTEDEQPHHQLISRPIVGGLCPLVVLVCANPALDTDEGRLLQQKGCSLADNLGGLFRVLPLFGNHTLQHLLNFNGPLNSPIFSPEHLEMLLHELCSLQLDSGHADLRVRVSMMCGDPFPLESVLGPLLDHTHLPIDTSGQKFWLDAHFPTAATSSKGNGNIDIDDNGSCGPSRMTTPSPSLIRPYGSSRCKARVCVNVGSYHHWLLAKWPLQSVQGHLLVFSPSRRASWRFARCAAELLLDSVGSQMTTNRRRNDGRRQVEEEDEEDSERSAMGRSIMLLAISEPGGCFREKKVSSILTKAERFAHRIGAMFFELSPNKMAAINTQIFLDFFQRILQNPFPPADYYTISTRRIIYNDEDYAQSRLGHCSTLTGSAETLLTDRSANDDEDRMAVDQQIIANMAEGEEEAAKTSAAPFAGGNNELWRRRKSKQSKIALVGSPPANSEWAEGHTKNSRKFPPPVLRHDSHLSRTTASTLTQNGCCLSSGQQSTNGTTRTPMASAGEEDGEANSNRRMEECCAKECEGKWKSRRRSNKNKSMEEAGRRAHGAVVVIPIQAQQQQMVWEMRESQHGLLATRQQMKNDENDSTVMATSTCSQFVDKMSDERASPKKTKKHFLANFMHLQLRTNTKTAEVGQPIMGGGEDGCIRDKCKNDYRDLMKKDDQQLQQRYEPREDAFPSAVPQPSSAAASVGGGGHQHRFPWRLRSPRSRSSSNGTPKAKAFFYSRANEHNNHNKAASSSISPPFRSPAAATEHFAADHPSPSSYHSSGTGGSAKSDGTAANDECQSEGKRKSGNAKRKKTTLAQYCAAGSDGVPSFLVNCVQAIEQNEGLSVEGIYRIPGNQTDVERLFQSLEKRQRKNRAAGGDGLLLLTTEEDISKVPVHAIGTCLKRFLDTLPEPLIPEAAHQPILLLLEPIFENIVISAGGGGGANAETELLGKKTVSPAASLLVSIRDNLAGPNRRVLFFLIEHLRRVAQRAAENSMDLRNLSKIWTPTIFRPNFESFEKMANFIVKFEFATLFLLIHCDSSII